MKQFFVLIVALTHEHYTLKRGLYYYDDWFGLLTLVIGNHVHRIAAIISKNTRATAEVVCRQLGFGGGTVVRGPFLELEHDSGDYFSTLYSNCNGSEATVEECSTSTISQYWSSANVSYIFCYQLNLPSDQRQFSEYYIFNSLDFLAPLLTI